MIERRMKPPERWVCPTCQLTVTLHCGHAIDPPTCPHGGTPRAAAQAVLMVLDVGMADVPESDAL